MQNEFTLPPDFLERQLALDPTQSFICEAPAGSGKTELLTQRFLTLLSRVKQPEEILAITFTRKATGEMRERIVKALHEAQLPMPEQPHKQTTWKLATAVIKADQEHQWQLLENPTRLRIQTFDSLCTSLTRQLPLESSLGAQPQIHEDAEELYRRAVRSLLATFEQDTTWADALSQLLSLLDNRFDRFEDLMIDMLARRESWLPLLYLYTNKEDIKPLLEKNLQRVICEKIELLREKIPTHLHKKIIDLVSYAAANIRAKMPNEKPPACLNMNLSFQLLPEGKCEYLAHWLEIYDFLLTKDGKWRKALTVNNGFPPGETKEEKEAAKNIKQQAFDIIDTLSASDGLQNVLLDLSKLPDPKLDENQWNILQALFNFLPHLAAKLTVIFGSQNAIDFTELNLAARRAFGSEDSPSNLALRLDYQLQHILVDEFQDTSSSQVDLLNRLTQGWTVGDGRTLFCVGDAMQSIYAFRGANVGLFLHCREQGLDNVLLKKIQLTTNFRSQAGIVEWTNQIFSSSFPQTDDINLGAVVYSLANAIHPKETDEAVNVTAFVDHQDQNAEANYILETIRQTRADTPEATIAILVRNRNHAAQILKLLNRHAIRYTAVDLEPLENHAVIQDLLALTRALLHPADRTAWLAVLRAPWCGLCLADLEIIANTPAIDSNKTETKLPLPGVLEQCVLAYQALSLSDDGRVRLQRVLPILQTANTERDRKTFRQWVQGCWLLLGGPAVAKDETSLKNAEVYFNLLESWEYSSSLPSFDLLMKKVKKLYAQPDSEADQRLQIMTIHKSKGLEFDVVIVPGLNRKSRNDDAPMLLWQQRLNSQGKFELLMAPLTKKDFDKHPTYKHLTAELNKKQELETCRLLYVACTRARKKLYLSFNINIDTKDPTKFQNISNDTLLKSIWNAVQLKIKIVEKSLSDAIDHVDNSNQEKTLYRLHSDWQQPVAPQGQLLANYIPQFDYQEDSNQINLQCQSNTARHTGTVVHRYLQAFAESGLQHWPETRIHQCQSKIKNQLKTLGVSITDIDSATQRAIKILCNVINDSQAQKILSNNYSFSANEFAVTLNTASGPLHLVMDRVYQDHSGHLWIIDYKTSEPGEDQSLEDFYQQEVITYQQKMSLYKMAMERLGDQPVKMALYFPVIGGWREIE